MIANNVPDLVLQSKTQWVLIPKKLPVCVRRYRANVRGEIADDRIVAKVATFFHLQQAEKPQSDIGRQFKSILIIF
jgi:hypothetical protein